MSTIVPFLPPLRTGLRDLTKHGEWEADDAFALHQLSSALDVRRSDAGFVATTSIPDLWAQPLSFLMAWSNPSHPRFGQARGEWRGLLAVLALQELLDIDIRVLSVDLGELGRDPWVVGSTHHSALAGNLIAILATFCPRSTLSLSQSWSRLGLIASGDEPIGLIVPANLVCPAREYHRHLPAAIDWRDEDGRLVDPCAVKSFSSGRASALEVYLDHALRALHAMISADGAGSIAPDLYGAVFEALTEYRDDVRKPSSMRRFVRRSSDPFMVQPIPQGLIQMPFAFLAQQIAPSQAALGEISSEVFLPARPEGMAQLKGVIAVGQDMAKGLGRSPQELRVWGPYSQFDFFNSLTIRRTITQQAEGNRCGIVVLNELFTDVFTEVDGGDASAHPPSARDCLLPLDARILQFLDPRALRSNLRIIRETGIVRVELDLPLQTGDGKLSRYTVTKTYGKEMIRRVSRPTVLATWPNFTSECWKHHYVFYTSTGDAPRPRQAISRRILLHPHNIAQGGKPVVFLDPDGTEHGIFSTDHHVEALACDIVDKRDQPRHAGLLLLSDAAPIMVREDNWRVGVDVGTTNTAIHYMRVGPGAQQPSRVAFEKRLGAPFGEVDVGKFVLQGKFLPDDRIEVPFLSILEERGSRRSPNQIPLIDDRVHYVRDVANTLAKFSRPGEGGSMRFDLKWSTDPANLARFEAYLGQICMQCLAELVALGADPRNVEWSFSQPGSFSSNREDEFREVYGKAIRWASGVGPETKITPPAIRLESEAAALYFLRREDAALGNTVFTLDIGGQTTDICLWHNRRLLWQTSVHFAGQHILIPYLAHRPEALSEALKGPGDLEGIFKYLKEVDATKLPAALEVVVNSDLFRNALDLRGLADRSPIIRGLEHVVEFSLAGILYYLGQVARKLTAMERLLSLDDVRVCLGGRGSLVFKSVIQEPEPYESYFSEVAGVDVGNLSFRASRDPKHEVSYGMLVPIGGAGELDRSAPYGACILGEQIQVGEAVKGARDILEPGDEDRPWRIRSIPEFETFLELYNRRFGRTLSLDARRRKELIGSADNGIADLRQTLQADRRRRLDRIEPPFFLALRLFLAMMTRSSDLVG